MRKILFLICVPFVTNLAYAQAPTSFAFIQNNIDNEYFITPSQLNPRFTGANVITKYDSNQRSIGYMGYNGGPSSNQYLDIWLDNIDALGGNLSQPFIGNRCMNNASSCPKPMGYREASIIKKNGAYKIPVPDTAGQSNIARAIFSNQFYEFAKTWPSGSSKTFQYRFCSIAMSRYPTNGQTCADVSQNSVVKHDINVTKNAHLTLNSTNSLQELFIDSNGNITVGKGASFCQNYVNTASGIGQGSGVVCKMVSYNLTGDLTKISGLKLQLKIDESKLIPARIIKRDDIVIGDGSPNGWGYWNVANDANKILSNDKQYVAVFFKQAFLKNLITNGKNMANTQDAFTFLFTNTVVPQSGFYEFTPSNQIIFRPREYGIGVIDASFDPKPSRTGKIGKEEPPIQFDYIVTVSGPRNADEVTAQVKGDTYSYRGVNYCLFHSSDNVLKVPFSSYLSYKNQVNGTVKKRNACGDDPIYIQKKEASATENTQWQQVPWSNAPTEGSFYHSNISLIFPMNEDISTSTIDTKADWIGNVRGQGNIEVKALWRNVQP